MNVSALPSTVLSLVFECLPACERLLMGSVCRQWYAASRDPCLWRDIRLGGWAQSQWLSDADVRGLTRLSANVWAVDVDGCLGLTAAGFAAIGEHCPRLRQLRCSRTNITSACLSGLMRACSELTHLSLRACRISDSKLSDIGRLPGLTYLDLGDVGVLSDKTLSAITQQCAALQHVHVRRCSKLTDGCCPALAALADLQYLSVRGCWAIASGGVQHFQAHGSLQRLDARETGLASARVCEGLLRTCPQLVLLDVPCDVPLLEVPEAFTLLGLDSGWNYGAKDMQWGVGEAWATPPAQPANG